jgi:hypothetical protein
MRRTVLAACAMMFALLAAHAGADTPPFAPADNGVTKMLKLIGWIGSLDDLSMTTNKLPAAMGLPPTPRVEYFEKDGKQAKNWTEYLRNAPIWPGAKSTINYTVFEPDGPAGQYRRAGISFDLNTSEACVRITDMIARFGRPTMFYPVTDGGGLSHEWTLREIPSKILASGYFGPSDSGYAQFLGVREAR